MPLPPRLYADDDIQRIVAHGASGAEHFATTPGTTPGTTRSMPPSPLPSAAQRSPATPNRVSWPQASPKMGCRASPPPQFLQPYAGKGAGKGSPGWDAARPNSMPAVPGWDAWDVPGPEQLQRAQTAPGLQRPDVADTDKSVRFNSQASIHGYNPRQAPTDMTADEEWEAALAEMEWEAALASEHDESTVVSTAQSVPSTSASSQKVPKAPQMEPQIGPDGEDKHNAWLRAKMNDKNVQSNEANRKTLWELLSMYCAKKKCEDVLDKVGLAGGIKSGDTVYIRGHTGLWLGRKGDQEVLCNKDSRGAALGFVVEAKDSTLKPNNRLALRVAEQGGNSKKLGVEETGQARIMSGSDGKNQTQFIVHAQDNTGAIFSGVPVVLRSLALQKNLDIVGEAVRARTTDTGTQQKLVLEKLPEESEIPHMASDRDFTVEEQAWLLRRGVIFAIVDKQGLAKYVSGHKVPAGLLQAYTFLWAEEWRATRGTQQDDDQKSTVSGASRSTVTSRKGRSGTVASIFGMFTGAPTNEDKVNGDMFSDALRSFFANALRMSQLEADCVQRVIEAFAAALVKDAVFLKAFTASLLPEKERKTYRTPEECLFGLAYTTMMLNTDAHNQQVAQKLWDTKKFVGAGKDCGVTPGIMMQIFKNVNKEEL